MIERERLLEKIRALLAKTLAAGCTEAEAMTALAKAQALRDAHEVTEAELDLTKEEKAILRSEPPGTRDPHRIKWHLATAVAAFCNCEYWRRHRDKGGGLVFCGLPSDVQLATWLLDHLTDHVQAALVDFLMDAAPSRESKREAIKSFVLGCCWRIAQRLDELRRQSADHATSNARALVVVKDAAVRAKIEQLGIKIRCTGGNNMAGDALSFAAGHDAGDRASFARPVTGSNATLRLR